MKQITIDPEKPQNIVRDDEGNEYEVSVKRLEKPSESTYTLSEISLEDKQLIISMYNLFATQVGQQIEFESELIKGVPIVFTIETDINFDNKIFMHDAECTVPSINRVKSNLPTNVFKTIMYDMGGIGYEIDPIVIEIEDMLQMGQVKECQEALDKINNTLSEIINRYEHLDETHLDEIVTNIFYHCSSNLWNILGM